MSKGITYSCANVWRAIARAGGWWSVLRTARDWAGVFSMDEIEEHLVTLKRAGFLEAKQHPREGTVYAYTARCQVLPGETLAPVATATQDGGQAVLEPYRPSVMSSVYRPAPATYRPGAMDHLQCPSLHMGKRTYRGAAA
jgi:hypothetical protein